MYKNIKDGKQKNKKKHYEFVEILSTNSYYNDDNEKNDKHLNTIN